MKNLIYDFGKVLVDYDFEAFFRTFIPDTERCKKFTSLYFTDAMLRILDREDKPLDEIMSDLIRENNEFESELRTFIEHFPDIVIGEMEGMYDLLTRLKAEGHKLYGLTNWCSKVHITMSQYPIFQLLDGQIISSEEHLIKPEPAIYHRLCEKFHLKPEDCIFADDRVENIIGAQRIGMQGIVFKNAKQYEEELRKLLRENN